MAEYVVSPLQVPEPSVSAPYPFRNRSLVRRKPYQRLEGSQKKTKKDRKKVHWYEMEPFDDPAMEKRRLKCLSQKILDDKKRYEMEILKAENQELIEENEKLKRKLSRIYSKKSSRHQQLSDSDTDSESTESSDRQQVEPVRYAGK